MSLDVQGKPFSANDVSAETKMPRRRRPHECVEQKIPRKGTRAEDLKWA